MLIAVVNMLQMWQEIISRKTIKGNKAIHLTRWRRIVPNMVSMESKRKIKLKPNWVKDTCLPFALINFSIKLIGFRCPK